MKFQLSLRLIVNWRGTGFKVDRETLPRRGKRKRKRKRSEDARVKSEHGLWGV